MGQYYPDPYEHSCGNFRLELDLYSYAIQPDLKGATGIDASTRAQKTDLESIKTKADNLD